MNDSLFSMCGRRHPGQNQYSSLSAPAGLSRRRFLHNTALAATGLALAAPAVGAQEKSPAARVRVGVIGCNGRGMDHIAAFQSLPNVEVAWVCDVDKRALEKGAAVVAKKQGAPPKTSADMRRMLEDRELDAVSIAAPDHWHTPATVLACSAGKHVYVEKPGSHSLQESRLIVAAARRYQRAVQMGNQRRSWPWIKEVIEVLHREELGPVYFARCWYANRRASIGRGKLAPVPDWLDWTLWQGPAPEQSYRDNIVHYNWHWFWHWGTAELGNNGVHALDLARWGLQVNYPQKVTCAGSRYYFHDDWETPDTTVATFDFGNKGIIWEGQSCAPRGFEGASFGVNFYCQQGCLAMAGSSAKLYDLNQKPIREISGPADDLAHFANFIDVVRGAKVLKSEIEEGQKATLLCHLGNIACRTGRTLNYDPQKHSISGDKGQTALASREYRKGWQRILDISL